MLPFSDLIEWNLTANFLADHLNYDLLEPAYELVCTKKQSLHLTFVVF